jgi:hypothetical protein
MLSFLIYFPICWVSRLILRYAEFPDLFCDMLSFLISFAICWVSWFSLRYAEFSYLFCDMLSFLIYFLIWWVSWFILRYAEFPDLFCDMLSFLIYFVICWVSWFIFRYAEFPDLSCNDSIYRPIQPAQYFFWYWSVINRIYSKLIGAHRGILFSNTYTKLFQILLSSSSKRLFTI